MSETISTSEARGAVEKWLLQVQDVMLVSIRDIIERAIQVCNCRSKGQGVTMHCTGTKAEGTSQRSQRGIKEPLQCDRETGCIIIMFCIQRKTALTQ